MGKKNKLRACPALSREISSAECGAGRHATIACPAGCGYDLFARANYDSLLDSETRLDRRTTQALGVEIGADRVLRIIEAAMESGGESAANAIMFVELFIRRDSTGRSFAERWLAAGAPELDKDERVFFAGKARMRVVLLEILEVRADGLLRAIDLLEPVAGEILLLDRRAWARATRFQVMLVWAYPLPHYWRMCGGGSIWPDWSSCGLEPAEALGELIVPAGGPATGVPLEERRAWLAVHFQEMPERIAAVNDARRRAMWASMDAVSAWSEYPLSGVESDALDARLIRAEAAEVYAADLSAEEKKEGFTSAYDVCLPPGPDEPRDRSELLGRMLRRETTWRLEATGRMKLGRLKARFFGLLEVAAREPEREMAQDFGLQQAEKIALPDEALVPPRLLENFERIELKSFRLHRPSSGSATKTAEGIGLADMAQAQASWVDSAVPALDGLTPRAAVEASPAMRARVARLVKTRLHAYDEAQLRGKILPDPKLIVRSLGLTELEVPAPPPRPRLPEPEEDQAEEPGAPMAGPGLEVLPDAPLSEEQAMGRLMQVQRYFTTDDDLLNAWEESCPDWAEAVSDWGAEALEPQDFVDLEVGLALAWAGLGGADHPSAGLRLNGRKLRAAFKSAWSRYDGMTLAAEILPLIKAMNPSQPGLQNVIQIRLALFSHRRKGSAGPLAEVYMALAAWLDAAVPELTHALAEAR